MSYLFSFNLRKTSSRCFLVVTCASSFIFLAIFFPMIDSSWAHEHTTANNVSVLSSPQGWALDWTPVKMKAVILGIVLFSLSSMMFWYVSMKLYVIYGILSTAIEFVAASLSIVGRATTHCINAPSPVWDTHYNIAGSARYGRFLWWHDLEDSAEFYPKHDETRARHGVGECQI